MSDHMDPTYTLAGLAEFTQLSPRESSPQWACLITCPICHFEYNHPKAARTVRSDDNYDADWGGRGDLQILPFTSECGHVWELCIGFHKGNCFLIMRYDGLRNQLADKEPEEP